ncbi:hypothetical protein Tco_1100112 [Tanacetum coccineum]
MHILNDPSFFLTNKTGALQGEELGLMNPLSESSCNCSDSSFISDGANRYGARATAKQRVQPWENVAKQRVTQSFSPETIISFPSLGEEDGTEGPMVIEAEIGRHSVHQMYVDGGESSEVLYEHCFVRLQPKIRSQMIPATTSLIGFSGETIWPIGQISLLARIGDEEHSTSAWMNFMVISTRNVKIPGKRRNGNDTKQQSHPDEIVTPPKNQDNAAEW